MTQSDLSRRAEQICRLEDQKSELADDICGRVASAAWTGQKGDGVDASGERSCGRGPYEHRGSPSAAVPERTDAEQQGGEQDRHGVHVHSGHPGKDEGGGGQSD